MCVSFSPGFSRGNKKKQPLLSRQYLNKPGTPYAICGSQEKDFCTDVVCICIISDGNSCCDCKISREKLFTELNAFDLTKIVNSLEGDSSEVDNLHIIAASTSFHKLHPTASE